MAKILHRLFEIYDTTEEAIGVLTSRSEKNTTGSAPPGSWTLKHLAVSHCAGVIRVKFTEAADVQPGAVAGLREDFAKLADELGKDSKVLVDFTEVVVFPRACIDALLVFSKKLRTKGSRIALCCLAPTARASFFLPDERDRQGPPR